MSTTSPVTAPHPPDPRNENPRNENSGNDNPRNDNPHAAEDDAADGRAFVTVDGVEMARITDADRMPPFLMTVVSDSDLWMFVSSRGGLTAGRVDPDHALFPYETDDKLHKTHPFTGPATVVRVSAEGGDGDATLWEPFRDYGARPDVTRNLYKSVSGNRVVFEEVHHGLGLTFRYRWAACDAFGWVRSCSLVNHGRPDAVRVELLDGLLNLIPAGLTQQTMAQFSCLTNAYTRGELDASSGLAVFAMSSLLVDRAEPAEALWANVAWRRGLPGGKVILDEDVLDTFRNGGALPGPQEEIKGRRGVYLVHAALELKPNVAERWDIVADVDRSQADAEALRQQLENNENLAGRLRDELDAADANLVANIASSDGLQHTADRPATAHHFANVLFNNMRGGVFADGYHLPGEDYAAFVRDRNRAVARRHADLLGKTAGRVDYHDLLDAADATGDADLRRLTLEYLPITFSRRHGDPSRPWNRFEIKLRNPDGSSVLNYQGNWRDIFQNWESMCVSFPRYFESIVTKFVNASTADGFNPYRVTRDGIDWEAPEPENPWAGIGYWGDHQIVYLLKLLEHSAALHPGKLETMLGQRLFTYADVPYRLAPYDAICRNPQQTITFDFDKQKRVEARVAEVGADGKLLHDARGQIVHVTLAEKLLVPALSKLSNFVAGGGIWMNTQRPEWNDANNALVGDGVSMVTLCYLRRYAAFMVELFERYDAPESSDAPDSPAVTLSAEVAAWFDAVAAALRDNLPLIEKPTVSDADRRKLLDALGGAFSQYREKLYAVGPGSPKDRPAADVVALFRTALRHLDHTIDANRRDDGLYHAYNLLAITPAPAPGGDAGEPDCVARVDRLNKMLEGQVAVLSTGRLDASAAADLIASMYDSDLYRADQHSFLLYPDRRLPGFFEKNQVPADAAEANPLLSALLAADDRSVIQRDAAGRFRFHGDFAKADDLDAALSDLAADARFGELVDQHRGSVLSLYEKVFNHRAFTGRSGGMFGYEGLGCIYWHMVSKLLLAVQESFLRAEAAGESPEALKRLADTYYRVRAGLSSNKTARQYGAFPTDPYSHTPGHRGAQQPGMTGQVKEEILTRLGEFGVRVRDGRVTVRPTLLRRREFLGDPAAWEYVDASSQRRILDLPAGSLAFTYAQVPVVLHVSAQDSAADTTSLRLTLADGTTEGVAGDTLGPEHSAMLFDRTGEIARVDAHLAADAVTLD